MRYCSGCKRLLSVENFCRNKKRKDGLHTYCRECAARYKTTPNYIVYLLIFDKKRFYVGVTKQGLRERLRKHKSKALNGAHPNPGLAGLLSFFQEPRAMIVARDLGEREARAREKRWISLLESRGGDVLNEQNFSRRKKE